jgi:hypothetical protein
MKYHEKAVEAIRLAGQELMNRAEEFVPNANRVINTEIVIRIPTDTGKIEIPTLEVRTEVAPSQMMLEEIYFKRKEEAADVRGSEK